MAAGIKRVVVAAKDPNPSHAGRGFKLLRRAGIEVLHGVLADEATRLNEVFNHWIVHRTPFVTVKAAMTLDGKIATSAGESKWITGEQSRAFAMKLRANADAILVGVNTVLADDPALTARIVDGRKLKLTGLKPLRRIVLDSQARTPVTARLVTDDSASLTTIVASKRAPAKRLAVLRKKVRVEIAPLHDGVIDLRWLMKKLGAEQVTSLLVEGGGEVNASFLFGGHAHRVAFFYAPKILGGRSARKGVAGDGVTDVKEALRLRDVEYRWLGPDLLLTARVK
jgi:diaminohydroxyphosphoribosylaminopyrimidine deaminase/5-amino-6-(5-phosphoribosylamino)uracil reductase